MLQTSPDAQKQGCLGLGSFKNPSFVIIQIKLKYVELECWHVQKFNLPSHETWLNLHVRNSTSYLQVSVPRIHAPFIKYAL